MPREQSNFERLSGIKESAKILVIASEGTRTEPQYFKAAEELCDTSIMQPLHLKKIGNERGHSSPKQVLQQIQDFRKNAKHPFKKTDQFWLVLDVDGREEELTKVAELCEEHGIQVAISNPAIEIWLLMHVLDIEALNDTLVQSLLENKRLSNKHTELSEFLSNTMQETVGKSYTKSRSQSKSLMPYLQYAAQQAERITRGSPIPDGLGSYVYKILKEIGLS